MEELFIKIIIETWNVLCKMAPYLFFGFFFAGLLSIFISTDFIQKHLGKNGFGSILKASFLGVPMPLCSCSVIPVATSLKKAGASNGSTASFLISAPQTGIDSIFVTYALLGLPFAIFKPIAAFVSGVIGGIIINIFAKETNINETKDVKDSCSCSSNIENNNCDQHSSLWSRIKQGLHFGLVVLTKDIAKPLLLGLIITGIISAIIPEDFFANSIGTGLISMFIVLLISIPIYVCDTSSVPVAAALILSGFSPGAALVFLMAGPATNAATISTIWKVLGKTSTIIYLIITAITAIASGLLFDSIINITNISTSVETHSIFMETIEVISAIAFILLVIYSFSEPHIFKKAPKHNH